ncbi:acyl-CoA dehydrogenase family protein [Mycobacterium sp. MBM]|nr:acyl-CoA dehydrogenase family protein [Mycobacterium sp. MBM]
MRGLTSGFPLSDDQRALLDELKAYLDENFPDDRAMAADLTAEWASDEEYEWLHAFNRRLAEDGWLIPHWPVEWGGRGLTDVDQMLIREELAYRRIPLINVNGLDMLGPILLRFGTDEQKRRHLPGIAKVDTMWCQGFSEPEAGSDLTSLRTTAVRDGDHYVVNGSKVWTGHAMRSTWMILLCRTEQGSRGSRGLSLLLVDMPNTPGVEMTPTIAMTGAVTFCQESFVDALVPVENIVGAENEGWAASRALLEHERGGPGTAAKLRRMLDDLLDSVADAPAAEVDAVRLGGLIEKVEGARAMAYEMAEARSATEMSPHMPSVFKLFSSALGVELSEVAVDLLGLGATEHLPDVGAWTHWEDYLYSFLMPIAGGSNEIQHEIIASSFLGVGRK